MAKSGGNNIGKDGLKYSTGINLSGFDPVTIANQFDDIDVRNGSQKIHFSRSGATSLNAQGLVHENAPTTLGKQEAAAATKKAATSKTLLSSPLVIAGGIGVIGVIGLVLILHARK